MSNLEYVDYEILDDLPLKDRIEWSFEEVEQSFSEQTETEFSENH